MGYHLVPPRDQIDVFIRGLTGHCSQPEVDSLVASWKKDEDFDVVIKPPLVTERISWGMFVWSKRLVMFKCVSTHVCIYTFVFYQYIDVDR